MKCNCNRIKYNIDQIFHRERHQHLITGEQFFSLGLQKPYTEASRYLKLLDDGKCKIYGLPT